MTESHIAIGIDSVCLYFMSKNNVLVSGNQLIWWPKGNPPQDRTIIKADVKTVSMSLYIPMVIVSIIGIIMAIILIVINNKFDYRRIIQHSHPSCNNLILLGNILCLLATIPLGFNTKLVNIYHFKS